jgi:hypothetical protein
MGHGTVNVSGLDRFGGGADWAGVRYSSGLQPGAQEPPEP